MCGACEVAPQGAAEHACMFETCAAVEQKRQMA